MPRVVFTQNLKRHIDCPETVVEGKTVREALDSVFADRQKLRGYVLDDQSSLRQHMVIFIDGKPVKDRRELSDPVEPATEIFIMQALSGG